MNTVILKQIKDLAAVLSAQELSALRSIIFDLQYDKELALKKALQAL